MIYIFLILFLFYIILAYRSLRYLNKEEKLSIKNLHRKYKLFRYLQYLLVAIIFVMEEKKKNVSPILISLTGKT